MVTMTDDELQQAILQELNWEPSVNAGHVGVVARDGVVTLSGHVESYAEKLGAERAAKRVHGVIAVANEIDVKSPSEEERTDEDIAAAVIRALQWTVLVPVERIKVTVSQGWVTLEGQVKWDFQRKAAELLTRVVDGVNGVTNSIAIIPRASPSDVKRKIEDAFKRNAVLEARRISADLTDGKLTLRGTVGTLSEKDEAERIAWSTPGVTQVDNRIVVVP